MNPGNYRQSLGLKPLDDEDEKEEEPKVKKQASPVPAAPARVPSPKREASPPPSKKAEGPSKKFNELMKFMEEVEDEV